MHTEYFPCMSTLSVAPIRCHLPHAPGQQLRGENAIAAKVGSNSFAGVELAVGKIGVRALRTEELEDGLLRRRGTITIIHTSCMLNVNRSGKKKYASVSQREGAA